VSFGDPVAVNVSEQPPAPPLSVPLHICPVLAVTVTVPVGTPPLPLIVKFTVTDWLICDGFGLAEPIAFVLAALFTVMLTVPVAVE